ncbi:MAG: phosphatase PAP2 family protein [Gammaproteobacteria bacterium]
MQFTMTWRHKRVAAIVAWLSLLGALPAAGQPSPTVSRPPIVSGYLQPEQRPDHTLFLPAPPAPESILGTADMAVYRSTRALEGGARWQLAAHDADIAQRDILRDFKCSLGVDLGAVPASATTRFLTRASADLFPLIGASKDYYKRPRPFLIEKLPLCIVPSEELARGGSYPSGHSATGWLYALLLAEAAPDHAAAILGRGRAYGESRVVCGVHYLSDIEGGRTLATVLVAAQSGSAEFAADLAAARSEVGALVAKAAGGDAVCTNEASALKTPW